MNIKAVIKSQYHASLEMLKQAIVKCPESLWDNPAHKNKFWHVAYHALFYTHLYLQPSESDFTPWTNHRDQYHSMGTLPEAPDKKPEIGTPYRKDAVLEYLDICRAQVEDKVDSLNLADESGFDWLPMDKMELQFYNIRHLQHHAGELCERLGETENIDVDWVGMKPGAG